MRIITGSAKGTKLKTPRGLNTRPTADRVKESIFNILGPKVIDAKVLDLFAGTGNLGLESLSRGADNCVSVDCSMSSIKIIHENCEVTRLTENVEIYKSDVFKAIHTFAQQKRSFDIIFCDPPYNQGLVNKVLEAIEEYAILTSEGIIIIEHSRHEPISADFKTLKVSRIELYGETVVSFLSIGGF